MVTATKKVTAAKATARAKVTLDNGTVIKEYMRCAAAKKEAEKRIEELREYVERLMADGAEVESEDGKFTMVDVAKKSWTLDDLKATFGDTWEDFATANNTLCTKYVDSQEKSGKPSAEAKALSKRAKVDRSSNLRFNAK